GIDRLGGVLRIVEVTAKHVAALEEDLAVLVDLHRDTGERHADGAALGLVGCERDRAATLAHAVDLAERDADGAEPRVELGVERGGTGDHEFELVEAEQLAD